MSQPYPTKSTGPAFLTQCACFGCRKSFKKDLADPRYIPPCPECNAPLTDMGRYFRAPRKDASRQWRKVEMLYRSGVYFAGTQSWALGKFPDTILEAKEFIIRNESALKESGMRRDGWRSKAISALELREAKKKSAYERKKSKK